MGTGLEKKRRRPSGGRPCSAKGAAQRLKQSASARGSPPTPAAASTAASTAAAASSSSLPSFFTSAASELSGKGTSLLTSTPWTHLRLKGLFHTSRLLAVRAELGALQRTFKETDLFKVFQSGDLANVDEGDPTHREALKETIRLRRAIYSNGFRRLVQEHPPTPPSPPYTPLHPPTPPYPP